MGDDNELRLFQVVQIAGESVNVPVVQSGINLVQQTEGRRPYLQNGKVQRRSHKSLFAAGQQRNCLDLLSGGLHPDLNAAGQRILRVLQDQLPLAAAEHLLKHLAEIVVDLSEFFHEDGGHFLCDIPDDALQFPLGCQHIVPLFGEVAVPLIDPGIFIDGAQIGGAQSGDFPFQLSNAFVARGHGIDLTPGLSGGAGGQAIGIPQLIHDLPFLHGGCDLLLLQQGAGPLHIEDILILLLGIVLSPGLARFRIRPVHEHFLQGVIHCRGFGVIVLLPLLQGLNLSRDAVIFLPHGVHQRLLFLPVALHGGHQAPEIFHVGKGGGTLGVQRRFFCPQLGHAARDGIHGLRRLGLAALQACRLLLCLTQILLINLDLRLLRRHTFRVAPVPGQQSFPFLPGRARRLANGIVEHLILLFLPLQAKNLILRLPELIPGSAQLELHLVKQSLGLLQRRLFLLPLGRQLVFLGRQLFQLIGPG